MAGPPVGHRGRNRPRTRHRSTTRRRRGDRPRRPREAGCTSTTPRVEQRAQDRRCRRHLSRCGRSAQPTPQSRSPRGPHHGHAAAHRAPRRPGRRAHPMDQPAARPTARPPPRWRRAAPRHHRRRGLASQDPTNDPADHQRKQIARDVVRDLRRHEASIKAGSSCVQRLPRATRPSPASRASGSDRRQDPRVDRRHQALPQPGALRQLRRHRTHRRLQRRPADPPLIQTGNRHSTPPSTSPPSPKHATPVPDATTTDARSPNTRPSRKPAAASNDGSQTPSTAASWPTSSALKPPPLDTQRRS